MARGHGRKGRGKGHSSRCKAKAPSWRNVWTVIANPADGSCGLYGMLQLLLVKKRGMSASEAEGVIRRAAGTQEMRELLMACRRRVVDYLRFRGCPELAVFLTNGKDSGSTGSAGSGKSPTAELASRAEWEVAILEEGSYIAGIAILVLGRIFGIPDVRIVYEVREVGLVDKFNPNDAVEPTDNVAAVLWSRGNHFEAMVPIAHDAGTEASTGNDPVSVMEFCLQALNRPADDSVDDGTGMNDGAFVAAVIEFARRIPRRTGSGKKVHKTRGIRKCPRGRTSLTRSRASRFRDIYRRLRSIRGGGDSDDSGAPLGGGATADAGLPPPAPEVQDATDVSETHGASVDAGLGDGKAYTKARLVRHSTCVFSLPNLSPIPLVWTVQAPAFGGAFPSASASSTTPSANSTESSPSSADSTESSTSSTDSVPSAPSSADSVGSSTSSTDSASSVPSSPDSPGGGPDGNTPEGPDAMDVSGAAAQETPVRVGTPGAPVVAEATVESDTTDAPDAMDVSEAPVTVGTTSAPASSVKPRSRRNAKGPRQGSSLRG
ncbi:unnamed protein product [Ectocarpus sp. CCAP 1310/34]|nr:unnamed protein product [Ectocarpus sp. CCAP 1310/34]